MKEKLKNNKGITLVALIITIVVMIVLVGVAVVTVIKSGIINRTEDAGKLYENAQNQESSMGEIKVGIAEYESLEDYVNGIKKPRGNI